MKKPENFSAGATKKTDIQVKVDPIAAAINGNFQKDSSVEQISAEPAVIQHVEAIQPVQNIQTPAAAVNQQEKPAVIKEKKESFLVSMSQGERSLYKSLCALQNVSMNHFVICAMDYFKEELENGKVSISKHGYKRV